MNNDPNPNPNPNPAPAPPHRNETSLSPTFASMYSHFHPLMLDNATRNMNGDSTQSYSARLEAFRKSDEERDQLVTEIILKYDELKLKFDEKHDDWQNEVASRRMWQSKAQSSEQALTASKQASGSNNFILVLIDGDGAIFQDHLYANGKEGGAEAAHQLHSAVKEEVKATYPDAISDWSIVVHVVLNMQGLATKLASLGIISNPNELGAFARAFGVTHPLFNIIDVGNGKERADHKLREMLRLYIPIAQCKHVFWGPCNDNGYLTVFEQYRRDAAIASRITLIETRPAEPGFRQLGFKICSMNQVFRTKDLSTSRQPLQSPVGTAMRPSLSLNSNSLPFIPKPGSPVPSTEPHASVGASTWRTIAKSGGTNASKSIDIAPKKVPARRFVLLNVNDERLDQKLPDSDPSAEARYAKRMESKGKASIFLGQDPPNEPD